MKVYITKLALTQGITERTGETCENNPRMFQGEKVGFLREYFFKPYWHESLEEAKKHAEELRQKKLKALQKQIQKLEKMKF